MDTDIVAESLYKEKTESIIAGFYKVYNSLGYGFLEKVYENALRIELKNSGHSVQTQFPITVYYENHNVGNYFADLLIDDKIILEIKTVETLKDEHECQLINYLKATEYEIGLLLNFGKKPEIKRKIYTNNLKKHLQKRPN